MKIILLTTFQLVMAIYIWKEITTLTISWEEKSDMSSGWTYSDDAAGLTAGDSFFDDFFGYSAVLLDTSGVETAEITQEGSGGAGKLDITQLGTLTSGDNVMIKFPVRGIKMTKSGSVVTLSITKELNKTGYQYYAFQTGTLSNPGIPKDQFYLGAYKACNNSNVLKSWSGRNVTVSQTLTTFCTQAKANGSGYNIIGFYQRQYINALYMMKYGNPNSQSVVGQGYTGGNTVHYTGGTNGKTSATYGNQNSTVQVKLFGLEDRWGSAYEHIGGIRTSHPDQELYVKLSDRDGSTTGLEGTGDIITMTNGTSLSAIAGDNKAMFAPVGTVYDTSYNTYYSDYAYVLSGSTPIAGGYYSSGANAGAFNMQLASNGGSYSQASTRLMYL